MTFLRLRLRLATSTDQMVTCHSSSLPPLIARTSSGSMDCGSMAAGDPQQLGLRAVEKSPGRELIGWY